MAGRIRTIKPEVLEDEIAVSLSDTGWRLWVSSWVLADDDGRFRAGTRLLAADVWKDTARSRDALAGLAELAAVGFVEVYELDGQRYARIKPKGWQRHQKISRPSAPRVPAPNDPGVLRVTSQDLSGELRSIPEGSGKIRRVPAPRARAFRDPTTTTTATGACTDTPEASTATASGDQLELAPLAAGTVPSGKGTRCPEGDTFPDTWYQDARKLGFDREEALARFLETRDYWLGIPGGKGLKSDWRATFRKRLRQLADWDREKGIDRTDLGPEPPPRKPPRLDGPSPFEQMQAEIRAIEEQGGNGAADAS